jgi:hypothetical protein
MGILSNSAQQFKLIKSQLDSLLDQEFQLNHVRVQQNIVHTTFQCSSLFIYLFILFILVVVLHGLRFNHSALFVFYFISLNYSWFYYSLKLELICSLFLAFMMLC